MPCKAAGVHFARMDNSGSSHSILDTLRTVEFRLGLKGYNVDEVDEYLEKAAVEAEQVQERLRTANERLRHATERVAQLEADLQRAPAERAPAQAATPAAAAPAPAAGGETEDALRRTLVLAQKFVEQAKRESEAEAAQVVTRAEDRARSLLGQAEERARQITADAEERLRDEVARLEETRSRLASDVEAMSRHLEEQRTKIRSSLTEALGWLDERMPAPDAGDGARGTGERPPSASPERRPTGDAAAGGGRAQQAGASNPATTGGGGAPRPQAALPPPGSPDRPPSGSAPSQPAPERTAQAPVVARLGALNGGLFDTGVEEANGVEENHLDE
jgi:DivIVA domain-containing protein